MKNETTKEVKNQEKNNDNEIDKIFKAVDVELTKSSLLKLMNPTAMKTSQQTAINWLNGLLEKYPNNVNVVVKLASVYYFYGYSKKAIALLITLLKEQPKAIAACKKLAEILHLNKEKERAITLLEAFLEHTPDCAEIIAKKGWVYFQNDNFQEALQYYAKACDEFKFNDPDTLIDYGSCFIALDQWQAGVDIYLRVLNFLDNENAKLVYLNLGRAYLELKQLELAREYTTKAIKLGVSDAYVNRVLIFMGLQQYKEAAEDYEIIIRYGQADEESYANLTFCYLEQGLFQKAVQKGLEGLKKFPDDEHISFNLGVAYANQGKFEKAISYLKKCCQIAPRNTKYQYNLADFHCRSHQFAEAKEILQKIPKNDDFYKQAQYLLSDITVLSAAKISVPAVKTSKDSKVNKTTNKISEGLGKKVIMHAAKDLPKVTKNKPIYHEVSFYRLDEKGNVDKDDYPNGAVLPEYFNKK